jgi:hypothetical protein
MKLQKSALLGPSRPLGIGHLPPVHRASATSRRRRALARIKARTEDSLATWIGRRFAVAAYRFVTPDFWAPSSTPNHAAFRLGTFLPFLRAFDRPIAMACLRLLTFPLLPLRAVPRL